MTLQACFLRVILGCDAVVNGVAHGVLWSSCMVRNVGCLPSVQQRKHQPRNSWPARRVCRSWEESWRGQLIARKEVGS